MQTAFEKLESWIRTGNVAEARAYLLTERRSLRRSAARRLDLLAAFYRRVGIPEASLRLLVTRVRPTGRQKMSATPEERMEYAAALAACGAATEALALLHTMETANFPAVHLHRGFALFREWNYADAIPNLESYVSSPRADPYFRRVGEVNLAAALVYERRPEAEASLARLLEVAGRENALRLLANVYELKTQWALYRGHWYEARHSIEEARRLLRDEGVGDSLYIAKWEAILRLREHADAEAYLQLEAVQRQAETRADWENVRDIDRELALARRDEWTLRKLYFGTPYVAYRARLQKEVSDRKLPIEFGHEFDCVLGRGTLRGAIDLRATGGHPQGPVALRLLRALSDDLYAAPTLATLHARMHPERYFNILSSPDLIRQSVTRARRWLSQRAPGLAIRVSGAGRYRLEASRGAWELKLGTRDMAMFPQGEFGVRDYMRFAQLQRRSAQRRLGEAVAENVLDTVGDGKKLRYRRV